METAINTKIWLSSPHMVKIEQLKVKEVLEVNFTDGTGEDMLNTELCFPGDSYLKGKILKRIVTQILKIIL